MIIDSNQSNIKPRYKHECKHCIFLGQSQNRKYDLYFHIVKNESHINTVFARFGDHGDEYKSGLFYVGVDPELTEAYEIAQSRNLI